MKAAIIYMSHHGTTEKVVHKLDSILGYNTCKIINISTQPIPDLNDFDTIIIGGSVHLGIIQKELQEFCSTNLKFLLTKRVGLFMCYMDDQKRSQEFENSFPSLLREHSVANGFFGGEFIFEKMNVLEKTYIKATRGKEKTISRINSQAINHFAILISNRN